MKRFLICLFSFLFIGCSIAGGAVLLSNSSYSDEYRGGDSSNSENDVTKNAPTNDDSWLDNSSYYSMNLEGSGTIDDPYLISSPEELAGLAYGYNYNYSIRLRFINKFFKQTANLDMSAHYWEPIGTNANGFVGSYNGGNYTISGLYMSDGEYQGLFGYVGDDDGVNPVEISNVNIVNSEFVGDDSIGSIVGYCNRNSYTSITNCGSSAFLRGYSRIVGTGLGGLVGHCAGSIQISFCSFTGTIETSYAGEDLSVGGILGYFYGDGAVAVIANCHNTGNIDARYADLGGIVGNCDNGDMVIIRNCYNEGNLSNGSSTGGIVGRITFRNGIENSRIQNCYNLGNISGTNTHIGGIVGVLYEGIVTNCYNKGVVELFGARAGGIAGAIYGSQITNCFNVNYVSGNAEGAIAGWAGSPSSTINNCYWGVDCTTTTIIASGTVTESNCGTVTEEEVNSESWYLDSSKWDSEYPWDFDYDWNVESGVNDSYPTLSAVTYTITYNANRGSGSMNSSTKIYDVPLILTLNKFARTGYDFIGWSTSSNGSVVYQNGDIYTANASDVLYAVWSTATYTITYNSNGGSGYMSPSTKTHGVSLTLRLNTFTRTGYTFQGWATSANGSVVYADGARYTSNASITLYAVWSLAVFNITIDWQFGDYANTSISLYYNQYYADESGQITSFDYDQISHAGFSFMGCYTSPNGQGNITVYPSGEFVSTTITQEDDTWYCYWTANNPAMYDDSGYWYVELGMMPQTKVTDETTILALNGTGLTSGNNYHFGDLLLESSVYGNEEYCEYNGNWYKVEPIKWRLDYSTSQTVGFGTTDNTLAVMDTIVFVSQFSNTTLNSGDGYSTTAVTALLDSLSDTAYFVTEEKSMPTFGSTTINGTAESVTSNIFVASREEIAEVAGNGKIQFSDLVKDYLISNGQLPLYYTRDLGTNYNNIFCMNSNGESVQYKPQNYFGVQFSVLITEYACVE